MAHYPDRDLLLAMYHVPQVGVCMSRTGEGVGPLDHIVLYCLYVLYVCECADICRNAFVTGFFNLG